MNDLENPLPAATGAPLPCSGALPPRDKRRHPFAVAALVALDPSLGQRHPDCFASVEASLVVHATILAGVLLVGAGMLWWVLCHFQFRPFSRPAPDPGEGGTKKDLAPAPGSLCDRLSTKDGRVQAALKDSPIMLFSQDRNLRYTWMHNPSPELFGMQVLGRRDVDVWERRDEAGIVEALKRQVLETGEVLRRVLHLHLSSGERVFDMTMAPLQDERGQVTGVTGAAVDITQEYLRAKENEHRYRLLFENTAEVMCLLEVVRDREGNIVDWIHRDVNAAFVQAVGMSREVLIGKRASGLWGSAIDCYKTDVSEAVEKNESRRFETYVRALDRRFDVSLFPLCDGWVAGIGLDITAHKRSEEQLRIAGQEAEKSLRELQAIIGNMTESVTIFDGSGRVLTANQAAINLSGYANDEQFREHACGGADIADLYEVSDPDERLLPREEWPVARALRGETCSGMEIRICRKDTGDSWIGSYSAAPIWSDTGQVVRVILTGHDITDQKRAEQALQASELRLRRLVESGILGVHYGDESGRIFGANDAFLDIVGYTREELCAGRVNSRDVTASEYHACDEKMLIEAKVRGACTPYEKEYIRKNGTRVPVLLGFALLEGSQSEHICFTLDRTAQKRLEEELRKREEELLKRNEQLAAADRAKDEFLAVVSHELRTPLTSILGWAQLLRRGTLSPEKREHGLEIIERNVVAQTRLIDDLLDVSRIISGKLVLDMQPVEMPAVIEAAIDAVRPAAEAKGIAIDCRFETREIVYGDASRLRQISYNLLSNGIKFTPKGGRVTIACESAGAEAVVSVSDTGIGIDRGFLPYVFNRFQQADQSVTREHQGLGLGLAIVRHLVELHGGTICAESAGKNRGSTFFVRLPAARNRAVGCDQLRPQVQNSLAGMNVLVVEDEPDSREVLVLALQHYGASATSAGTVQDALDRLDEVQPDLLVCDIGLPGEDGYSLIRRLRARPAARGGLIPAVALTAYARVEDRTEALSAGYQDHIAKPVEAAALAEVIARLAAVSRSQ
jgi:hypothetical protein